MLLHGYERMGRGLKFLAFPKFASPMDAVSAKCSAFLRRQRYRGLDWHTRILKNCLALWPEHWVNPNQWQNRTGQQRSGIRNKQSTPERDKFNTSQLFSSLRLRDSHPKSGYHIYSIFILQNPRNIRYLRNAEHSAETAPLWEEQGKWR